MITLGKRDTLHSRRQAAAYLMTPGPLKSCLPTSPRDFFRPRRRLHAIIHAGFRIGAWCKPGHPRAARIKTQEEGKKDKAAKPEPVEEEKKEEKAGA